MNVRRLAGRLANSSIIFVSSAGIAQQISTIPLYEERETWLGPYSNIHLTVHSLATTSPAEVSAIEGAPHSVWHHWINAMVLPQTAKGAVPLLRYNNPKTQDHLFTTDPVEGDLAQKYLGYLTEGVCCYVSPVPFPGSLPLYRVLYENQHLYFAAEADKNDWTAKGSGGRLEGIAGYIWPLAAAGSTAPSVSAGPPGQPPGPPKAPSGSIYAVPLYQFRGTNSHYKLSFVTDSIDEYYQITVNISNNDWQTTPLPKVMAFPQPAHDLVALYRYNNPRTLDHLFTTDNVTEGPNAMKLGYQPEGVCCYISPTELPGTIPLWRASDGHFHEYLATDHHTAVESMTVNFHMEGALGYVWPQPSGGRSPPLLPVN